MTWYAMLTRKANQNVKTVEQPCAIDISKVAKPTKKTGMNQLNHSLDYSSMCPTDKVHVLQTDTSPLLQELVLLLADFEHLLLKLVHLGLVGECTVVELVKLGLDLLQLLESRSRTLHAFHLLVLVGGRVASAASAASAARAARAARAAGRHRSD